MSTSFFKFKQFTVYHDRCAMKVGTDGVLLGAWAGISGAGRILDAGTGSGLISLMLAQRSQALIDAIDIDYSAYTQAEENIRASVFSDRIRVFHLSLHEFAEKCDEKYDLVVSNPPFFSSSLPSPVLQRTLARHNDSLSLADLLKDSLGMLKPAGRISLILPYDQEEELDRQAAAFGLYFRRKTYVIPTQGGAYKRILAELTPEKTGCATGELVIEISRHNYTDQYISLTKDFYLKM